MTQEILNIKQYLRDLTVENACSFEETWSFVEEQKEDHNFKILKISANTVEDVIRFMAQKSFYRTYNEATHWFIIVINIIREPLELNVEHLLSHETSFDRKKPIIIQWETIQSSDRLIYFRKAGEMHFCLVDVSDKELLTEEELTSQDDFQFPLILKALQSELGGSFNGNLLDITIDVKREFDTWRLIDYAARSDDSLSLRFLMLFPWNLHERNEDERKVLEIATEYASPQTVAALLNLPMSVTPETEILLTTEQMQLLLPIEDITIDTPLTIAIEKGRTDTLTFLINCGADMNYRKKFVTGQYLTLTQLAWSKKRYYNMLALLKADSPYPNEYNIGELDDRSAAIALKKFTEDIIEFHQALHESNIERIESFIKNHPRLKKVHDLNNQSALMTALEAHQYETFTLLQSKGFTMAENEDLFNSYDMLSYQQKEDLKVAKLKYFKKQDNTHILFLLSKSKIHLRQSLKEVNQDYFAIIKDLFEQLDDISEMSTIMKVLEHSESFEINFCFDNDYVTDLKRKTIRDYKIGRLHIEVEDSYETISRLACELISLAIQNVYKNDLKPYSSFDKRSENQFEEIVTKCYNNLKHSIIGELLTTYQKVFADWTSAFIVCIPLCLVRNKEVTVMKNQAPELFSFYENHVQKDFVNFIKNPQRFKFLYKIESLNDLLGEVNGLQQAGIWLKEECLSNFKVNDSKAVIVVVTSLPQLVQADIYQTINRIDSELNIKSRCIFTSLTHFKNRTQAREIYDCYQSFIKPLLIVDCTRDFDSNQKDLWTTIENFREKNRTILIMRDIPEDNRIKYDISTIEKHYNWNDLKTDTQNLILGKSVDFQGYNITLNELVASDIHIINLFPLELLIHEKEKIKIGKLLSSSYGYDENYYIVRTFNSQLVIKDSIIRDELTGVFHDRLAYTERDFRMICEQYPRRNVHWLMKEPTGQLVWQRSRSADGFRELYKYIDTNNKRLFTPDIIDQFLERVRLQKVIIIADTVGMGKTTVLTHLSKLTKEKLPKYWVLVLNLSIYTEEFEKQIVKQLEVTEFVIEDLLKFSSSLEKMLFKQLFNAGRVVLMLDGFDEICPRYKAVVTDVLMKLSQTPIEQLWVSTRPHLTVSLEYRLNQLSYGLEPFSVETQVAFLVKFWKKTLDLPLTCEEFRMQQYATALLEKLSRSIKDTTIIFTGIPLQTRMLAEAFTQEFRDFYFSETLITPELPETLDLLAVYERFLQNKYRIYVAEKNKPPKVSVATKDLVSILKGGVNLRKIHQQLALEVLFPGQREILLRTKKNQSLSQEQLSRIGIVQYVEANKMHFIHRTFAEYYAADFFINQFINQSSASVHIQKFLLTDVLLRPESQIVRNFFNGLLTKVECSLSQSVLAEYATQIEELWRIDSLRYDNSNTILYVAVEEKNSAIVKLLLSCLKMGEYTETLRNLLLDHKNFNRVNYNRRTAIYQASSDGCLDMLNVLWLWAKEAKFNATSQYVRFFLTKDESSATLWHDIAKRGHVNVFVKLYQWASEVFNSNYLKDLLTSTDMLNKTVWHYAVSSGNIDMFHKLQVITQEVQLEPEHLREIFSSTDEHWQGMWHYVASKKGNLNMLDHLVEYVKHLQISSFRLKKIFLSADKDRRTVWHLAAISGSIEKMRKIWELGKEISLNREELKQIVLGDRDQAVCQSVAKIGREDILLQIWMWAKELELDNEELKELVFTLDINRSNVWLLALSEGHLNVLEVLWHIAEEINLQKNDFQQMLFHTRVFEGNGWFLATAQRQVPLIEKLWTYINAMGINMLDLQAIILEKTRWKTNSLQLAAENGDVAMIRKLLELLGEVFTLKQLSDILLTRVNQTKTLWHYASVKQRTKILNIILDWGEKQLDGEMLDDFWKAKAKYEEFILLVSTWKDHSLEIILKWSKKNLSSEEFKKIILRRHLLGKCAWESTWKCEDTTTIIGIMRWCKQHLTAFELIQVMRTEDGSLQTLFRLMVERECLEIFIDLWNWDEDVEARTAFKYFFTSYYFTKDAGTILHCAMRKRDIKTLTNFWKWGQQMRLSKEDYRNLVLRNNSQGDTFCHIAVWVSDKEPIDILMGVLDCAKAVLDSQDLKELLKKKNFNNQNVLHFIACSKRSSQIIQLLAWCIINFSRDEFQELMLDRCQQEATVLHVLARTDLKTWFSVIEWLENAVEWNIFSVLFLAVDYRQQNSMKVAKVEIARYKIEGTLDEELYDKSASLPTLEARCKNLNEVFKLILY